MAHIQKKVTLSKRSGKKVTRWQARYRGSDGRERTKRFDRKVDAEAWLNLRSSEVSMGTWIDPRSGLTTFGEYATKLLADRSDLRPTTQAKYEWLMKKYVMPEFGLIPLSRVTPQQVRSWFSQIQSSKPSTAAGAYRLLASIFNTAVSEERIPKSPCRLKGASSERAAERPTITVAELKVAIAAAPDQYRLAIELAAWCQLRRGEVLGLQRQDINLLHGSISVRRTWTQVAKEGSALGPPKTEAGSRTVSVPTHVLKSLESHLERFVDHQREAWLFDGRTGNPTSPRTIDRVWVHARTVAERPDVHFHDLRHSGLTWTAMSGASAAELMLRAGHKSPTAAMRYQHATTDRDRAIADALSDLAIGTVPQLVRTDRGQEPASEIA